MLCPVPLRIAAAALVTAILSGGVVSCGGQREARGPDAGAGSSPADLRSPPRIILLISIDTLRADHLGAYGYPRPTSPVLDRLAAEGALFEDASATAPWTLPSHASMLTGRFPSSHRVLTTTSRLPRSEHTLASLLATQGYQTAAVVNSIWLDRDRFELTREFERYLLVKSPADRRSPSRWVTDQVIDWLEKAGDQRVFVFAHYYDVHSDYASLPVYEKLFVTPYAGEADGSAWQLETATLAEGHLELCRRHFDPRKCSIAGPHRHARPLDGSVVRFVFDEAGVRHDRQLYDAGIRQLDAELERLFGFLRDHDLMDDTLLVVTSDHGEEFMEHGSVHHFLTQYQEVLHVPLVFRGPGIPAGLRVETPVSLVDVVPTILSFAGAAIPDSVEGLDLTPLLRAQPERRAPQAFRARYLYGEASGGLTYRRIVEPGLYPVYRSVRSGRFKLVQDATSGRQALYDLELDPGEQRDASALHPRIAAGLGEVMAERYADPSRETPSQEDEVELDADEAQELRELGYLQ